MNENQAASVIAGRPAMTGRRARALKRYGEQAQQSRF